MAYLAVTREGHRLEVTLTDPRRRNAMSAQMRDELIAELTKANGDADIRVIVIRGAGGAFCSGGDLGAMPPKDRDEASFRLGQVEVLIRLLAESPKAVIAVLNGPAVGLGASLAAACDYIFMTIDAVLIFPFTRLGLIPDGGILHTLGLRVGYAKAKHILLEARSIGAEEALKTGLADVVLPLEEIDAAVAKKADLLASRAPLAIAAIKAVCREGPPDMEQVFAAEQCGQQNLYFSNDFAEGKAAFQQRRAAIFTRS